MSNKTSAVVKTNPRKAVMIGCGFVGSASVFALMQSGLFSELVLIDADKECLQHAQGAHAADPEFLIRLLDRIEPQSRQIDQGHFHAVLKLQPHHTAAYNTALFLIQLIGL